MKANQLRIGNKVKSKYTNGNPNKWVVVTVTAEHIKTCNDFPKWFKPIALTEEWLFRMGFKVNEIETVCYLLKKQTKEEHTIYGIISDEDNFYGFYQGHSSAIDDWDSWTILKYVNTVHELQNLYFSLTGEELTIK
jgi:hypothetical protein